MALFKHVLKQILTIKVPIFPVIFFPFDISDYYMYV